MRSREGGQVTVDRPELLSPEDEDQERDGCSADI